MRILSVIFSLFVLSYLTVRDMAAQSVVRDTVLVYFEQGLSGIAPSLRGNQKSLDSIAAITGDIPGTRSFTSM